MDEVNCIPEDEVIVSFTIKSMHGEIYNIENVSSLNIVYILESVLVEMTAYSPGKMFLHCCDLMRDDFAIEYYGLGDGSNVLLCPRLRTDPRTRIRFRQL